MTFLYEVQHVTCFNCMVIRRGCWPAKILIIAPRSSGMLSLIYKRAKPVRRSSPIVVYIEKNSTGGGGVSGQRETPPGYAPGISVSQACILVCRIQSRLILHACYTHACIQA